MSRLPKEHVSVRRPNDSQRSGHQVRLHREDGGCLLWQFDQRWRLIGYRIAELDWIFTNITAGVTHLLVSPGTPGFDQTGPISPWTFELRVTNWAYDVQIDAIHVAEGEKLIKLPNFSRRIEVIGDSLASGMYTSYEGLSSWA